MERREVELVRGLHGHSTRVAVLDDGALISEGALLEDLPHFNSAFTRAGAMLIQFSQDAIARIRQEQPDLFYRLAARVAQALSRRLRLAARQLTGRSELSRSGRTRREHDLLGEREVPAEAYYGIQTLRAVENFPISGTMLSGFQDAVPMTLGQVFGAYAVMIGEDMERLGEASDLLKEINLGATAIGTGVNSPPGYADLATQKLHEVSGMAVVKSGNLVEATQDSGAFVQMSGVLKRVAVKLSKICNDLRLLSSGPRCGLQEIRLPAATSARWPSPRRRWKVGGVCTSWCWRRAG